MRGFAEDEVVQKKFIDAALSRSILPAATNGCMGYNIFNN